MLALVGRPDPLVGEVEQNRQQAEHEHGGEAHVLARHHLRFGRPHQEGRDVFRHLLYRRRGAVLVGDDVIRERRRHLDPAGREDVVLVEGVASFFLVRTGEAVQQGMDVFRPADAVEQLRDAGAVGAVEARAGLRHQAQVRAHAVAGPGREEVGVLARTLFLGVGVDHRVEFGRVVTHPLRVHLRATLVGERTDRHEFQAVAGRADLPVDLEAAAQLLLVEAAEGALEGEGEVLDAAGLARSHRTRAQHERGKGRDQKFFHDVRSLSLLGRSAVVVVEVFFDRRRHRRRFLDQAEQRQDHEEVGEPVGRADQRDVGVDPVGRHRAHPHQHHEVDREQPEPPFEHRTELTRTDLRGVKPGRQRHRDDRAEHRKHAEELRVDDAEGDPVHELHRPDVGGEGAQDRVERQEVPFRHDMRGGRERVRLDVVVGVAEVVRHEADDGEEDGDDQGQREQVLDHEIRPEGQGVLLRVFLRGATHFDARRVVVAGGVEGPDMDDHQPGDDEGQQVVQREEAVQRRVVDGRPAQQPGLDRRPDARDRAEEAGDDGGAPERHLAPGQHVAHEGGAHHQQVDDHADDPRHFARGLVRAVVEAAEDVDVDGEEEQRGAVRVHVADRIAAVHVAHDVLDRGEGQRDVGGVVHHQHHAGADLQHQAEGEHDAPDPPPVQVLRRRDHDRVIDQRHDGQTLVQPLLDARLGLVMVVRNSSHVPVPLPLAELDRCVVGEGRDRNVQVARRGALADAAGRIVMRAVARAEPAAEIAGVAERHAAEVSAHAHHHQPFAGVLAREGRQGAVLVRGVGAGLVGVLGRGVGQRRDVDRTGEINVFLGAAADEHRLAAPFHRELGAGFDARDIDVDRGHGLHVGRGVHLVDQRPDGHAGHHRAGSGGGIVEEIPPGACVFCVGHEIFSLPGPGIRPMRLAGPHVTCRRTCVSFSNHDVVSPANILVPVGRNAAGYPVLPGFRDVPWRRAGGPRRRAGSVGGEHVAEAPHRLQVARFARVGFDLAPQPGDLHVDRAVARAFLGCGRAVAAELVDQVGAADHFAGAGGKDPHQGHLGRGQPHRAVALPQLAAVLVIAQRAERQVFRPGLHRGGHATQDRVDPQQQLLWLERLRQIVVGAGLEPLDPFACLAAGGEQQDRCRHPARAQIAGQAQPVLARHHHVEHDHVELEPGQQAPRMRRIARRSDKKAVADQELLQKAADPFVIVDDQQVGSLRGARHQLSSFSI
ncbi:hypothetical protein SDC9_34468 [bioreactor metagenome]|uniref:Uncharacterized protein n=1 Tax=bioreactor metagenome TaxID=1076179 RepID=A0A644VBG5_9ZZZZ